VQAADRVLSSTAAGGRGAGSGGRGAGRRGSGIRPVDPAEAARGRLDYAQVKDWGGGAPGDLGGLTVKKFTPRMDGGGAELPLFQALGRQLEVAQSCGLVATAEAPGAKPLPPFERWSFREHRYAQFAADTLAAHRGLEAALGALGAAGGASPLASTLAAFGATTGLARADRMAADLAALVASAPSPAPAPGGKAAAPAVAPAPGTTAASYARLLEQLADEAARGGETAEARAAAAAKLAAHLYALHAAHATTGTRIGAAAAERLSLFARGAAAAYFDYPPSVADARAALEAWFDGTLGAAASAADREAMFAELPRAIVRAGQMMAPLAHEA
jgi:hypothetical protein